MTLPFFIPIYWADSKNSNLFINSVQFGVKSFPDALAYKGNGHKRDDKGGYDG